MEVLFKINGPFSRTLECPKCLAAGRPTKTMAYVLYRTEKPGFRIFIHSGFRKKKDAGLTPHIIFQPKMSLIDDNIVCESVVICGIIGCGYHAEYNPRHGNWLLTNVSPRRTIRLLAKDYAALFFRPLDDYHLSRIESPIFNPHRIIGAQMEASLAEGRRS